MFTDPISDMLTRIRNAIAARKDSLVLPSSKFKLQVATLLAQEGFIAAVAEADEHPKKLKIQLKYSQTGDSAISGIKRVSKPGQRIYLSSDRLPRTNSGLGVTIVSTSKGLMSDRKARKEKIGGEIICQVW